MQIISKVIRLGCRLAHNPRLTSWINCIPGNWVIPTFHQGMAFVGWLVLSFIMRISTTFPAYNFPQAKTPSHISKQRADQKGFQSASSLVCSTNNVIELSAAVVTLLYLTSLPPTP